MDDAPRILGGRYQVGELIGRGGMAEVHIGHDTRLGRTVAIKILRSDLARDPAFQARFRREAQAAAALNHPAIVAVYDTGEDVSPDGAGGYAHVPFIVMEYVEGHTVRDILRDGAAVPIEEAVEITAGVLSALEYSHQSGIVHRDIKPANVMLTPAGAVKVMDFGIARAMADAAGTMTQTQAVIGTAQYLSPEQARGEAVDARSDLYSTGCLLFELLTGRPPFIGDSPVAVAYQHARETPAPPSTFASDVPENLDRIVVKALAKDRDQRYRTAPEFRADLEAAVRGGHVGAPPIGAAALGAVGAGAPGAAGMAAGMGAAGPGRAGDASPTGEQTQAMGAPSQTRVMPAWSGDPQGPSSLDGFEEEPEERRRPWLMWLLIGVAAAAVVGVILLLTLANREQPAPTTAVVPDVVGELEEDARRIIEEEGLQFRPQAETDPELNDGQEEGRVTRTEPGADTEVELDSAVIVYISQGPGAIPVPDVEGLSQEDARALLAAEGFDPLLITTDIEDHAEIAEDLATRTDPPAGESVPPDTPIVLYLSSGHVQLPDLTGQTEAQATNTLRELGLTPVIRERESTEPEGTVVEQNPLPGPVSQGIQVQIWLAVEPTSVTVPSVSGLTCDDAIDRLADASLFGSCQTQAGPGSDGVDPGRAYRTDPGAGAQVPPESPVTIYIRPEDPPEEGA